MKGGTMTKQESDDTKIAVINNNIQFIMKDIVEIKLALKDQYATRESLVQVAKDTEVRLIRLENASNLWKLLSPTFAAIAGSVLTFLLLSYLGNIK